MKNTAQQPLKRKVVQLIRVGDFIRLIWDKSILQDVKTKTATIASLHEENKTLTASLEEKTKAVKGNLSG